MVAEGNHGFYEKLGYFARPAERGGYMKLEYDNANVLLYDRFEVMKKVYDEDEDGYDDVPHCFYSFEFVPYILKQLRENNELEIKKYSTSLRC